MRLNAARVQSTSEILTWTPSPCPPPPAPTSLPQPPPPRAVCRSSSVWPCREAAAAPRCTHIKECVFAQACVPDALAYAPPPPHAPLPPLPYLGELFQPQPRGGKVGLAKISPRLVGAAQTLREFNSFLPRLAFLLRAVGRKRRNGPSCCVCFVSTFM